MKLSKLAVIAVAVLVVATGAAMAVPGDAPDGAQAGNSQADGHAQAEDAQDNETGDENATESAEEDRRGPPADAPGADAADGERGPPVDLPSQVPDFVSGIHDAIHQHLAGDLSGAELGETISALTPDDNESSHAENGTESAGQ